MSISRGSTGLGQVFIGALPIKSVYKGTQKVFEVQGTAPNIVSFTATPSSIDRDVSIPAQVSLDSTVTNCTSGQLLNASTGQRLALLQPTSGGEISGITNVTTPVQTTVYRLLVTRVATGHNVSKHQDVTVSVQQDLRITNFRRSGYTQAPYQPTSGIYIFTFRISGTPTPNRFVFSGALNVTHDNRRHFTPVSGQVNTWDFTLRVTLPTLPNRALTVVATNGTAGAAGRATATISDINA